MEEKKIKELDLDEMDKVSGGCGTVSIFTGVCSCGAELTRVAKSGGIAKYRCVNDHEVNVYEGYGD